MMLIKRSSTNYLPDFYNFTHLAFAEFHYQYPDDVQQEEKVDLKHFRH